LASACYLANWCIDYCSTSQKETGSVQVNECICVCARASVREWVQGVGTYAWW
jgi:hypothetical protein